MLYVHRNTILTVNAIFLAQISLDRDNLASGFDSGGRILGGLLENVTSTARDIDPAPVLSEGSGGDQTETGTSAGNCDCMVSTSDCEP